MSNSYRYPTGKWINWDGKSYRPECLSGAEYLIVCLNNTQHYELTSNAFEVFDSGYVTGTWNHRETSSQNVVAFYVLSYQKPTREMTVAEIEKELGYKVKVVK